MRRTLTGEQLRFVWREAGGDVLRRPLQVHGAARTRTEARLRGDALRSWWAAEYDGRLLDAVHVLRRPRLWLEYTTVDGDGRPGRGLLGVGTAVSTLVRQAPVREPAVPPAGLSRPAPGRRTAWSGERGGDCVVDTGHTGDMVARLCADLPRHRAADGAPMSAPLGALRPRRCGPAGEPAGYARPATAAPAERMRALAARPRRFEAQFTAAVPVGAEGDEPLARLVWLVAQDGGRLFDGAGTMAGAGAAGRAGEPSARTVRLRPAGTDAVATAVRRMLRTAGEAR